MKADENLCRARRFPTSRVSDAVHHKCCTLHFLISLVGAGVLDRPNSRTTLRKAPTQNSPVKIVGDNVTEKDYEDFREAFRKESTATPAIVGAEGYKTYSDFPDVQVNADGENALERFVIDTDDKIISGASITDLDTNKARNYAESYYEEIRHYSTDAQKIADNIGISYEDALKIKIISLLIIQSMMIFKRNGSHLMKIVR